MSTPIRNVLHFRNGTGKFGLETIRHLVQMLHISSTLLHDIGYQQEEFDTCSAKVAFHRQPFVDKINGGSLDKLWSTSDGKSKNDNDF